jgi:hypothetical protein
MDTPAAAASISARLAAHDQGAAGPALHWAGPDEPYLPRTAALVNASLRGKRGRRARARLTQWAVDGQALQGIPQLLGQLHVGSVHLPWARDRLRTVGRGLAFDGRDPEPVALGIALLGLGHEQQDRAQLLVLAQHDALAPFVSAALTTAGSATGGVDWLSPGSNPVVQRWLVVRFQFRSSPLDAGEALAAARADLLRQLQRMQGTDQELLDGAVGVVRTLLAGGPAGIDRYPEASDALALLLPRTGMHRPSLEHYLLAADVQTWLLASGAGDGVPAPERDALLAAAGEVMARPGWPEMVARALALPNHPYRAAAEQVAASLAAAQRRTEEQHLF